MTAFTLAIVYSQTGPGWDLISHYFNGRSLSNPAFYQCLLNPSCNMYNQNPLFYFESYRAPMAGFVLALLYLLFQSYTTIAVYLAVLFVAYIFALRYMAKRLEVNELLTYSLFLSPILLFVITIPGSEEIVSLIFVFVAIGLLARRSVWFGFFLGLTTLGKYPTLALLPMLLLLVNPRKIFYAALLFAALVLPWLVFSQVFFGNAFGSYILSLEISHSNQIGFSPSAQAYEAIFMYPLIIGVFASLFAYRKWGKIRKSMKIKMRKMLPNRGLLTRLSSDKRLYTYTILIVFFILSVAQDLYIGPYNDTFTQVRYGYLLIASGSLLAVAAISDIRKYTKVNLAVASAVLSIILFVLLVVYLEAVAVIPRLPLINNVFKNNVFNNASAELFALGYGNCKVVSNDWIPMMYRNVSAFSEFDQNLSSLSYPILLFKNTAQATDIYAVRNLQNANIIYSSYYYDVLLPPNYFCYHSG